MLHQIEFWMDTLGERIDTSIDTAVDRISDCFVQKKSDNQVVAAVEEMSQAIESELGSIAYKVDELVDLQSKGLRATIAGNILAGLAAGTGTDEEKVDRAIKLTDLLLSKL